MSSLRDEYPEYPEYALDWITLKMTHAAWTAERLISLYKSDSLPISPVSDNSLFGVHAIYFLLGAAKNLLYVGRSENLRLRLSQHQKSAKFTDAPIADVAYAEVVDKIDLDAEKFLIDWLRPPFNKAIARLSHPRTHTAAFSMLASTAHLRIEMGVSRAEFAAQLGIEEEKLKLIESGAIEHDYCLAQREFIESRLRKHFFYWGDGRANTFGPTYPFNRYISPDGVFTHPIKARLPPATSNQKSAQE